MNDRKKILIVEDDPNITKALRIRLVGAGYEVVVASDGALGLTAAVRERPDLILLDISMPAGGGFFVAENAKRHPKLGSTPIVFITASKAPGLREKAREIGVTGFLEKPFHSRALIAVIERALQTAVSSGQP